MQRLLTLFARGEDALFSEDALLGQPAQATVDGSVPRLRWTIGETMTFLRLFGILNVGVLMFGLFDSMEDRFHFPIGGGGGRRHMNFSLAASVPRACAELFADDCPSHVLSLGGCTYSRRSFTLPHDVLAEVLSLMMVVGAACTLLLGGLRRSRHRRKMPVVSVWLWLIASLAFWISMKRQYEAVVATNGILCSSTGVRWGHYSGALFPDATCIVHINESDPNYAAELTRLTEGMRSKCDGAPNIRLWMEMNATTRQPRNVELSILMRALDSEPMVQREVIDLEWRLGFMLGLGLVYSILQVFVMQWVWRCAYDGMWIE